ncbi:hypothetical protein K438DRAFT_1919912 [Mycena galopus ATCC 62051]|nr:hypothetical protein K438DRAFT_1919912 [Mycena galopus ATCC 62051]
MPSQEVFRAAVPAYPGPLPTSRVSQAIGNIFNNCDVTYGLSYIDACVKHAEGTFHAERILILSSGTLARSTSALADLEAALGGKIALVKSGLRAHTYFSDILAIADECKARNVDLIITLGGGTLTDAAKLIAMVLAKNIQNSDEMLELPRVGAAGSENTPTVPVICVSTTLSGGEFTLGCGATDDRDNQKHQFLVAPAIKLIVLDAALVTATTPLLLFVQSGIRALDHSVEALCSVYCNEVTEMHAKASLTRLLPGLLRCNADGEAKAEVEARLLCQMATMDAIASFARVYTPAGGSHAIGHILGPFGVVHGATSAILLPAVCKYNARHSTEAASCQTKAKAILWGIPEVRQVAERRGLAEGVADLGDLLDALLRELRMARTLAEVGVGRNRFDSLAKFSVLDPWAVTNPVPLTEEAQVMEILEMVAE